MSASVSVTLSLYFCAGVPPAHGGNARAAGTAFVMRTLTPELEAVRTPPNSALVLVPLTLRSYNRKRLLRRDRSCGASVLTRQRSPNPPTWRNCRSVSACLSACLPVCLPACLPACWPVRPSVRLSARLSVCLSLRFCTSSSVCCSPSPPRLLSVGRCWHVLHPQASFPCHAIIRYILNTISA